MTRDRVGNQMFRCLVSCLVLLFTLLGANRAWAEAKSDALHQRLESLDEGERSLLAPFMEHGPIGLVEFSHHDDIPAVLVASYVAAPAAEVARIIRTPADYP